MPSLALVEHDAQRRIEGGWQLVLSHPSSGERIADLVLYGVAQGRQCAAIRHDPWRRRSRAPDRAAALHWPARCRLAAMPLILRDRVAAPALRAPPCRGWRLLKLRADIRERVCMRNGVVEQRAGQQLAAAAVVANFLIKRLSDALD